MPGIYTRCRSSFQQPDIVYINQTKCMWIELPGIRGKEDFNRILTKAGNGTLVKDTGDFQRKHRMTPAK